MAADVLASTRAVAEGRYKDVNILGVSVITSVRNVAKPVEIPYVFGGDGALLCVPDRFVDDVRTALSATVAMASERFGMTLRAAVVPVRVVRDAGWNVLVARHRVSEHYVQSAFYGGGATWVEEALKDGTLPDECMIEGDPGADADYDGLECRWRTIPAPSEETVTLIVDARVGSQDPLVVYGWVLDRIRSIYGDPETCRPVREEGLKVSLGRGLSLENRIRYWKATGPKRLLRALLLKGWVALGWIYLDFGIQTETTDWGQYRADLVKNTDFRKFDGVARLVLTGSRAQREELEAFLSRLRQAGALRYGMSLSEAALVTCLIDERQGGHFHFVDGANGGYTSAAAALKEPAGG